MLEMLRDGLPDHEHALKQVWVRSYFVCLCHMSDAASIEFISAIFMRMPTLPYASLFP